MKLALFLVATTLLAQTDDKIWTGIYTAAQSERGKAGFEANCSHCHNADLAGSTRAPSLKGDRFAKDWFDGSVYALFTKLRDTMPATYPDTVPDAVKLDILTYLLQANGFPAGATELRLNQKQLESIAIVRKGARPIPNFALVQVVGCLEPGWTLTKATDPVITKEETTSAPESKPLGDQNYVLVSVAAFKPAAHSGQKMEARGLLYRQPGENRLNLTSLQMLSPTCAD